MNDSMWERWVQLYTELDSVESILAAPFIPFVPDGFESRTNTVLYIGKATGGDCDKDRFDTALLTSTEEARAVSERFSSEIFNSKRGKTGPNFWGFANALACALDPKSQNLENLCWSNVCKIGVKVGNPEGRVFAHQVPLAVQSLKTEIADLNPSIIVCVANSFADRILLPAIGNPINDAWHKSEEVPLSGVENVWWMPRMSPNPPILWMRHPQSSSSTLREFALKKVVDLISSD